MLVAVFRYLSSNPVKLIGAEAFSGAPNLTALYAIKNVELCDDFSVEKPMWTCD
jgi:hypothetical protein